LTRLKKTWKLGVAVAVEMGEEWGLIVPVVKNTDQKSLLEIEAV